MCLLSTLKCAKKLNNYQIDSIPNKANSVIISHFYYIFATKSPSHQNATQTPKQVVPTTGIEPVTSSLPRKCSTD